jgi:hypothetical protein
MALETLERACFRTAITQCDEIVGKHHAESSPAMGG